MRNTFISVAISLAFIQVFTLSSQDQLTASVERGEDIYLGYCITCHLDQGQGVEGVFPPIANSDYLMADLERAISVVKYGQQGEIIVNGVTYNNIMSPMGLTDQEVTDVLNFIRNSWGNKGKETVTVEMVSSIKN